MSSIIKNHENTIELKLTVPEQLLSKNENESPNKKTSILIFDANSEYGGATTLIKKEPSSKNTIQVPPIVQSIFSALDRNQPGENVERLAFEKNPINQTQYQSIYRAKLHGLPDSLLKRISIQDDLIAAIDGVRCNQTFAFGSPLENRFKIGFIIEPLKEIYETKTPKERKELQLRINIAKKRFYECGHEDGLKENERLTLPQFLYQETHNAIILGRMAVEIIRNHEDKFHSFRPIDAGTIYQATNQKDAQDSLRKQALQVLKKLKNERIDPKRFHENEYAWIQVVDGVPIQAFTNDECFVHNFYPLLDIELDGYPCPPIDRMVSAVTTHINIATHNKLYFQYGRASHGILVIQSDTVNPQIIQQIKQQFNAAINSVNASFRMPVFGIDPDSNISYQSIDNTSRDMEFQYLSDNNARSILSAFQMSPEELPGWTYLSKGSNSQALSESSNEWRLEAARDVGFRPLLKQFEDFLNSRIFPLIDEELSKECVFKFVGLDAENPDQEIARIQQNSLLHLTYNEILTKVEKKELPKQMGADFPLNPQYQAVLEKYLTVGQIKEYFFGIPGASKNPNFDYVRDPFYFQQQMLLNQRAMIPSHTSIHPPLLPNAEPPSFEGYSLNGFQDASASASPVSSPVPEEAFQRATDQSLYALTKAEKQLSPSKRKVLQQQKEIISSFVESWKKDLEEATHEINKTTERFLPRN